MDYLKKVVISLTNKTIQIWNLQKQKLLLTIDMLNGNMHNLVFNDQFQLILTSGFQKEVLLFQIDHKNEESNSVGKLIGHQGMVTCIQCIRNTSMVVTSDDQGYVKVWDIKKLTCF
jgi:WD40 repeat protein